jgi:hypothetical protein
MRRAFNYVGLVLFFPLLALLGLGLAVSDPFQFSRFCRDLGTRLRPLFEPHNCRICHALLSAGANDEHAGLCCNCVEVMLLQGQHPGYGKHREFCKGRMAE